MNFLFHFVMFCLTGLLIVLILFCEVFFCLFLKENIKLGWWDVEDLGDIIGEENIIKMYKKKILKKKTDKIKKMHISNRNFQKG